MKKKCVVKYIGMFFFGTFVMQGQQEVQYTQYMYNTVMVNPAYAATGEVMTFFGLHRTQWVGLDGAPTTNVFSFQIPYLEKRLGFGASVMSDRIGPSRETDIAVDVSYTIDLSSEYKLSFGLKGLFNMFSLDVEKLNILHPGDPYLQSVTNQFSPNIGAGVYLHSENEYLGLSVPSFLETHRYDDNSISVYKQKMAAYLIGGKVFELNPELLFKPAFLARYTEGVPFQIDLSANFLMAERFTGGISYRWGAALSALAGFQVTEQIFIGYSYDFETTKLANYNSGSHEIFLRFDIFPGKVKQTIYQGFNPRRFRFF